MLGVSCGWLRYGSGMRLEWWFPSRGRGALMRVSLEGSRGEEVGLCFVVLRGFFRPSLLYDPFGEKPMAGTLSSCSLLLSLHTTHSISFALLISPFLCRIPVRGKSSHNKEPRIYSQVVLSRSKAISSVSSAKKAGHSCPLLCSNNVYDFLGVGQEHDRDTSRR